MAREHTAYGRRKLNPEAYERQQALKRVTSASGVVYGSRKGDPGPARTRGASAPTAAGASPVLAELVAGLHAHSVAWAKERIVKLQTPAEVRAVHVFEQQNPKGARKGILNACEERLGELHVDHPSPGLERQPAEPEADDEPPTATDPVNPFTEGTVAIEDLKAILEQNPELLDAAIEAEFRGGAPRPEAIAVLLEHEETRAAGPRDEVVHLLNQFKG